MFGIDEAISAVSNLASTVVSRIYPDATVVEKAKLDQVALEIANEYNLVLGQIEINKVEAANPSIFVAGARPAAMWVGVFALAYGSMGISLLSWVAVCFGLPPLPPFNSEATTWILTSLLGIGGMRSFDKLKGIDTKKMGL